MKDEPFTRRNGDTMINASYQKTQCLHNPLCADDQHSIDSTENRGWLDRDFRLFHLKDQKNEEFRFHYHDFDKIIIFLSGRVTYVVEGKSYYLKPWDVLLVNHHAVHKPVIDSSVPYDRIVIWINSDFLKNHSSGDSDLTTCFRLADQRSINMVRFDTEIQTTVRVLLNDLEKAVSSDEFAAPLLSNTIFLQLIIYLNRVLLSGRNAVPSSAYGSNRHVDEILRYINTHLDQDLTIDRLAEQFFLSRSYLMHCFRSETGYTVHNYILQKRLLFASDLIRGGIPITEACYRCGFKDYSTFSRAYRKLFGASPRTEAGSDNCEASSVKADR